jgi:hypothetical protein
MHGQEYKADAKGMPSLMDQYVMSKHPLWHPFPAEQRKVCERDMHGQEYKADAKGMPSLMDRDVMSAQPDRAHHNGRK